jgi:hypothetical protein
VSESVTLPNLMVEYNSIHQSSMINDQ